MARKGGRRAVHSCECRMCEEHPYGNVAAEHRRINRLVALENERNRRLLAGFLARQHGRGGVSLLARVTGLSRDTILRGQRELQHVGTAAATRIRQPGGGRKRVEKKDPRL